MELTFPEAPTSWKVKSKVIWSLGLHSTLTTVFMLFFPIWNAQSYSNTHSSQTSLSIQKSIDKHLLSSKARDVSHLFFFTTQFTSEV